MTTNKYLFAGWGDGTNTYIFRLDKKGTILRAGVKDTSYHYIDRAEVPERVMKEFAENSVRFWNEPEAIPEETVSWNVQENVADTGITDQEFIDLVLEKWPNTRLNTITHKLETLVTLGDGTKRYAPLPNAALKFLANRNRYYGDAYWMK